MDNLLILLKKIKLLICDVDGVLTDGRLYIDDQGNESKAFHAHDGLGLKLLLRSGVDIAVITTSINTSVKKRLDALGIHSYYLGQIDKTKIYETIKHERQLTDDTIAYIGDDVPDQGVMQQVGCSFAVANAVHDIQKSADWCTKKAGGYGAVREVCDLIMTAQGTREDAIRHYLHA